MIYGFRWTVPIALAALGLCACDANKGAANQPPSVTVTDTPSVKPDADQVPAAALDIITRMAITRFLAGIKWESNCPNDTTCVYVQTFLGEATREITLRISPNRQYNRTFAERTSKPSGNAPIYDFKYASNFDADPVTIDLNFYVGREGLPTVPAKAASYSPKSDRRGGPPFVRLAARRSGATDSEIRVAAFQASDGAGVMWSEVGKKGADVAIGAVIDAAKDHGIKGAGPLGTIYSLASMVGDAGGAMALAKQNRDWQAELDALEECAANPTNTVSRSDPNYSRGTVAKIQAARSELTEVNAVRFLNQMAEKTADFSVVTTIMSVGLKQGFAWSEQTLGDYSENTIMREARLAVVGCTDPEDAKGNVHFTRECSPQKNDLTVRTIVANVTWEWQGGVTYYPKGTYNFRHVRRVGSCTETGTGQGNLEGGSQSGHLAVWNTIAQQKEHGNGYEWVLVFPFTTKVTYTNSCSATVDIQESFASLGGHGDAGTGGQIEGSMSVGSPCGSAPPASLTWSFAVPPAK